MKSHARLRLLKRIQTRARARQRRCVDGAVNDIATTIDTVDYNDGPFVALPGHNPTRAIGLNLWSSINEAAIGRRWRTNVAVMEYTAIGGEERAVDIRGGSAIHIAYRWPYRQ
jgi:hypothetical protein